MGAVPNLAKVIANSPALLKGWLAMSGALSDGVLPPAVRERLAIATAEYDGCEYCPSAPPTWAPRSPGSRLANSRPRRTPNPPPPHRRPAGPVRRDHSRARHRRRAGPGRRPRRGCHRRRDHRDRRQPRPQHPDELPQQHRRHRQRVAAGQAPQPLPNHPCLDLGPLPPSGAAPGTHRPAPARSTPGPRRPRPTTA